jgi:hypothetical protein
MNAASKLLRDLVDKRLWPVALLLVVAIVAIPVLIGRSSSGSTGADSAAVAAAATPAPAAAPAPAVELVGPPSVRSRPGKVRDPFRRAKHKVKEAASSATTSTSPKAAASGSSSPSTGSSSSKDTAKSDSSGSGTSKPAASEKPAVTTPIPASTAAADVAARTVYATVAHVQGPHADYEHPLDRLAAIGSKTSPALQYFGVTAGGKYAVFLLGPDTTVSGEHSGACVVPEPCRAIGVRTGETVEVDVAGVVPMHYVVEITALHRVRFATPALAAQERTAEAKGGHARLRALLKDGPAAAALGHLHYDRTTGTVALVGVG